ncbi:helix-turn-helix domain-containing protein [Conexibacter sp. SYSU D00693]|uniref:helix-turn-helix domain-containing protein n=1 Tax=Conexibacter sp. SYSU D00693 TaxID=2812560 RepID=UPI00196B32FB|nr:helix-turn-helix domain-containing protein [Conexibacter sp. SYSU D00693]
MGLAFETRPSDSSWVQSVWTCRSGAVTEMTSVATETWGLVLWEQDGRRLAAVSGPERATGTAPVPEGATFLGNQFAVGTSLRGVPTPALVDGGIELPEVSGGRFRLDGRRWEVPGADDAEALVARLVADGTVQRDPLVTAALRGDRPAVTDRTLERRFRAATGLSRGAVRQIARAREAAVLLASGAPAADVTFALGFYDEPHLARALRRYVGRTAGQLQDGEGGPLALDPAQRTTSYRSLATPLA